MSTSGVATAEPERIGTRVARSRRKRGRKKFLIGSIIMLGALAFMIYSAIVSNSEYYLTVSEAYALGDQAQQSQIKIGGKVSEGSVVWDRGSNSVRFTIVDDKAKTMPIAYRGVVPDSFQPGADVILEGKLQQDGSFAATTLLAKCASKYEPALPGTGK